MNGRRAIVGLCMVCALLVSAFAAQGASAASNGTTAFTCVNGAGVLNGAHCLGTSGGTFGHVAIAENTTTELTGTNANTKNNTTEASIGTLKETIAGVPLELSAKGVSGSGWMENKKNAAGEHYAHGKGTITFTEVEVTKPAGKGCKVTTHKEDGSGGALEEGAEGIVHTKELTATTEGQGDFLKFQPAIGNVFARFFITCTTKVPALEGTWNIEGSVKGTPEGATTTFTHAGTTEQGTLIGKGSVAGIDGSLTLSGRAKESGGAFTPLAATTQTK